MIGAFAAAAAHAQDPLPTDSRSSKPNHSVEWVEAAPELGFNFPYLLSSPASSQVNVTTFLLVEPNNTGHDSDQFADHVRAAKKLVEHGIGAEVSQRLGIPLLVPVFPRFEDVYTHMLNRRARLAERNGLHRIDLQLVAMVNDAKTRLADHGVKTNEKVLLTGFSASGAFVNRFTVLHPDIVQAVASGAVNGMLMLPVDTLDSQPLPFPIGVADIATFTEKPFQFDAWKQIPQFIYMGQDDTNDAVKFDDAYTQEQREIIYRLLGERMVPDRWQRCQSCNINWPGQMSNS